MAQSDTALSVRDRSLSFFFFLTPPRGTERHRSLGPRPILFFFFNATPWHRATLLSRSAIARVASVSVRFRRKERLNGASKERKGGTPWHRATPLLDRDRCFFFFFFNATAWHRNATLLALDQNVISSLLSCNHHLIGKESSVENIAAPRGTLGNAPKLVAQAGFLFSKGKSRHLATQRHKSV